jgi:phospholipid/cholesterol/gamma-HCH transport system permease protein
MPFPMAEERQISFRRVGDATLVVRFSDAWRLRGGLPALTLVERKLEPASNIRDMSFETLELSSWDSSLPAFLIELSDLCRRRGINNGLHRPTRGGTTALTTGRGGPGKRGPRKARGETTLRERVGNTAIEAASSLREMLKFVGEVTLTFIQLFRMKAHFRAVDLFLLIQECGARALPIVTLISFLVGRDSSIRRRRPAKAVRRSDLRCGSYRHRDGP